LCNKKSIVSGKIVFRVLRNCALFYLIALAFLIWGYFIGRHQVFPFWLFKPHYDAIKGVIQKGSTFQLQEKMNKFEYGGFCIRDSAFSDPGYLLLSRYSGRHRQVVVDLVRIQGFERLYRWIPPIKKILRQTRRDMYENSVQGYRVQHPLLLPDGSLVFHSGEGALVKIDKKSRISWIINEHFHHSIELDHNNHLFVPIVTYKNRVKIPSEYRDDGYAVISLDGEIIEKYSMVKILMDNGYRGLLLGVGVYESDLLHCNDIQPIFEDNGDARKGDIAVSIRHISSVLLYRPSIGTVLWLKTGPWLNQHDINILDDGRYSIFGNDMYRINEDDGLPVGEISNVYLYDPSTDSIDTPYTAVLQRAAVYSESRGRSRILPNGDVYIEETDSHRLLRLSTEALRWEYVNMVEEKTSGALHWCRYLTEDEVQLDWR
jgi:hypothetical protein